MKAVAFSRYGDPDVLEVLDLETPHAGEAQVRVRVRTAGVQPFDTALRRGVDFGLTPELPCVIGNEFAGVVDEAGEGVADLTRGDEVLGWAVMASTAEYVVVEPKQLVAKPAGMPWELAGVLAASGQTAHTALEKLGVTTGDTVLIHAAAGGVGTFAVQLARAWGATVIGTASEHNHEYLRSLGAWPVAYGADLVQRVRELAPDGVDAALDAAGEEALRASVELVPDRDRVVTLVAAELAEQLGVRALQSGRSRRRLRDLVNLYTEGELTVPIAATYPMDRAAQAHRDSETGHVRGKLVITVE